MPFKGRGGGCQKDKLHLQYLQQVPAVVANFFFCFLSDAVVANNTQPTRKIK